MIAENGEGVAATEALARKRPSIWRVLLGLLLGVSGLWLVTRQVDLTQLLAALSSANVLFILLGLAVIVATMLVKNWRWKWMFQPRTTAPPFKRLFEALALGQLVNLIAFIRIGDIARVYAIRDQSPMARTLGTLVVEKTLDMLILLLTVAIVLPFVVLPAIISQYGLVLLSGLTAAAIAILVIIAYRTKLIIGLIRGIAEQMPSRLGQRLVDILVAGLEGLAALRSRRVSLTLVGMSALIGLLSIMTPLVLFSAFDIPLGWREATLLHLAVMLGSIPPSTPAKIGIFEWIAVFMLNQFGLDDPQLQPVILSYALVYHLVVVLPQIILGVWAAIRTDWKWTNSRP